MTARREDRREPTGADIRALIDESWDALDRNQERLYRMGAMRGDRASEWRLSERRRSAIERGVISVPELDTVAEVISLDARRPAQLRHSGAERGRGRRGPQAVR